LRHAAKSQVGLTPARATDEIADQGDRITIMAEGGAGNKHPLRRATSGTGAATNITRGGRMFTLGKFARATAVAAAATIAGFATTAQAQDKGPIRIGFLPPITGPLASPGAEMVNGFRLFWEQAGMTAGATRIRR
jgi:hypothetical protein